MSTLLDLFGYLTVLVHGLELIAQTVLVGSAVFARVILAPTGRYARAAQALTRTITGAALATALFACAAVTLNAVVLRASLGLSWLEIAGAAFAIAGVAKAAAAGAIAVLSVWRGADNGVVTVAELALAAIVVAASLPTSHGAARLDDVALMLGATTLHQVGAALWLGALPGFWLTLAAVDARAGGEIGRRFSILAIAGVALIVAGAAIFAWGYIGSLPAVYGTTYGVMAAAKGALLALLLLLGLYNFLTLRRDADRAGAARRVRHVVEVEMALGFSALMAAASITSLPPSVDLPDRLAWADIRESFAIESPAFAGPRHDQLALPQLRREVPLEPAAAASRLQAYVPGSGAASPRNAYDVAWSEYNHHWAGVMVLVMGVLALLHRTGRAPWAAHWPLLFLALAAFVFVRADEEAWPLGDIGFLASMRDPEVTQHRVLTLLIAAFALFEWRVRTRRSPASGLARVFPALTAVAAVLLLGHSHALVNARQEVLVEISHVSIAVLGIVAAAARWLEIGPAGDELRWPVAYIWPACFVGAGLVLLAYGEA